MGGGLESNSSNADSVTVSSELAVIRPSGAATSAATSQLAWLNEVWSSFSDEVRELMLEIARNALHKSDQPVTGGIQSCGIESLIRETEDGEM